MSPSHILSPPPSPWPTLTSIKGEMMETIFMGMISIKYQLTWEPQPGMQCVKGKCTSHFHRACSAGKSRTLIRFDKVRIREAGWWLFNQNHLARPKLKKKNMHVRPRSEIKEKKKKSHGQSLLGSSRSGAERSSALRPPESDLPACPKAKARPRPLSADPGGPREPLAVRLYGPPLRLAEASRGRRAASRPAQGPLRRRRDPSARLSRPHLAPSPRSGGVRKCLAGAHRGGSLGGGGGSAGRGRRGEG